MVKYSNGGVRRNASENHDPDDGGAVGYGLCSTGFRCGRKIHSDLSVFAVARRRSNTDNRRYLIVATGNGIVDNSSNIIIAAGRGVAENSLSIGSLSCGGRFPHRARRCS
jgi:hypothetical protein